MSHRQEILGGINGELAAIIDTTKYRIGDHVTLTGSPDRLLTVLGTARRNDGLQCYLVCWFGDNGQLFEAALPEVILVAA